MFASGTDSQAEGYRPSLGHRGGIREGKDPQGGGSASIVVTRQIFLVFRIRKEVVK